MKKTWREILISKCIRRGNRHKWLKPLMFFDIVLIICIEHFIKYMDRNKKRLMGMALTVLVFLVSNSFSAPSFQNEPMVSAVLPAEEAKENQPDAYTILQASENMDALLFEGDFEHYAGASENQYSVDEILGDSHSQALLSQHNDETLKQEGHSKDDWNLILINKQHPVPEGYTFELGTITANMQCDARILPELFAMLQAAREDGVILMVCSPYRDISLQKVLFDRKIELYMGQGYNYMEAYKKASQIVTVPGASEHQVGLALDIISDTYTVLDEGFGETKAGMWLQEHSKEYGFILRYPKGKEDITGIDYEPWHFRYVGKEAATIIMDKELTLEEFVESISE